MAENTNTERDYPEFPEGWPARFRCDSCDGNGEVGDPISMGYFQPPERERCPDCDGKGWCSEEAAFSTAHMRAYVDADRKARASLSLPAAGQEPVAQLWVSRFETDAKVLPAANDVRPYGGHMLYLAAAPQPAVAAGWVMVPIEPTLEMITDATRAYQQAAQSLGACNAPWAAYRAMLAALPPAPSTEGEGNG
ncbi:hypothetical protein C8C99_0270 [Acidovorax sp. 107]|uniref:hypothetical protein n=1 Tax=Acidovorax sp. 107 TaxID=2135638 RepID=UPI000D4DE58E|nr:hypothetical protein [Acidovorax sp. 107]PUA95470.1 hypothetical protein C8C99_0270 [Acidovorax sp. 107]